MLSFTVQIFQIKTIAVIFKNIRTQVNGLEKSSYCSHFLVKISVCHPISTRPYPIPFQLALAPRIKSDRPLRSKMSFIILDVEKICKIKFTVNMNLTL